MVVFSLQGVSVKEIPYLFIYFYYVQMDFPLWSMRQLGVKGWAEFPFVGASLLVSHLFFADDSLLFCKASEHDCRKLIDILQLYEAASGQKVNAEKSSIIFSHNTPEESRRMVLDILGPMQDTRHGKYLGLPSIIGGPRPKFLQK